MNLHLQGRASLGAVLVHTLSNQVLYLIFGEPERVVMALALRSCPTDPEDCREGGVYNVVRCCDFLVSRRQDLNFTRLARVSTHRLRFLQGQLGRQGRFPQGPRCSGQCDVRPGRDSAQTRR